MKQLPVILIILLIALSVFGVYQISTAYTDAHKAAWQVESSAKAVMNVADYQDQLRNEAERRAWFTEFYKVLFTGLLIVAASGTAVYYWKVYDQRRESWARAVDGTFALQTFSNGAVKWQIDPNKQLTGTTGFHVATGALGEFVSQAGADRQLVYNQAIQRTRTASATAISEIRNSAQAKFASGFYDRPQQAGEYRVIEDEPAQLTTSAWQPLTLADAFAQSTADRWLLGQNATGACEFSLMDAQHVGILGAPGTGKTSSTATLMMLYALKSQCHVIALDGKGGVDWMRYKNYIEVYPTDYSVMGDQINELYRAYTMRMKALSLAGASDIYELDYQMKPVVIFLEEYGATMDLLKGESSKQHIAVERQIKEIFRKGRSAGIHLVLIDQLMNGWPAVMKANTKGIVAYKIGGQQGAAFNAYKLHELADKGQFWNNGGVYDAWFTKPEAERLLQKLQPSRTKLLTDAQYSVGDASTIEGGEGKAQTHPPIYYRPTIDEGQSAPVSYRPTIGEDNSTIDGNRPTIDGPKPPLTGKPITATDKELVRNTYALTGKYNKTCELLWGKWNPSRDAWAKAIVADERHYNDPASSPKSRINQCSEV